MAIYKRYKGRRLKRTDADWDEGTWWIEFSLRGQYVHQSVPGARTQAQGHSPDEILDLPDELDVLVLSGEPLVFRAGTAEILGEFKVKDESRR